MKALRLLAVIEAKTITGPAKNLLQFAALSPQYGVETVIATFVRGEKSNLFVRSAREAGVDIRTIPERSAFDPAVLRLLGRLVLELRPDVVQTHAVKSHFLARLAGLPKRAPWVAFHHGYTWTTWKTRVYNELDRWSLRAADRVLTVSLPFRDELAAKGVVNERIAVIHNAISPDWGRSGRDPAQAAKLRAEWGIHDDEKVLLIVGRLSKEKDHLALIDAAHKLREAAAIRIVIVGDGPEREAIRQRALALGISELVILAGQQPTAERFYGIADVAVLSSRTEGSPNALLEAMSAGVPAVATMVGGIPEIVEDGVHALLVPPSDVPALASALRRMIVDEPGLATTLAANARARIIEFHTPQQRAERLAATYRAVRADSAARKDSHCEASREDRI